MTSKRKTKQLRWLVTRLMLAMTMVMPASTWAQVMYTVYDTETKTLTFKYGDKPESTATEKVYDVRTDAFTPDWINNHASDITTVVFDDSFKDVQPTFCNRWFYNCINLTSIDNIENLNTANVTDMSGMFYRCKKLKSLDLSSFNTANVTDMGYMFYYCIELTSLNLSNFDTANVKYMSNMFEGCEKLTSLNLSSFNTANVTVMNGMFYLCSGLTTIYVSDDFITTINTLGDEYMFKYCTNLVGATKYNSVQTDINMAKYTTGYFSYGIKTVEDWNNFADKANNSSYRMCAGLMKDITNANVLKAIGTNRFGGTFDGCYLRVYQNKGF